MPVAHEWQEAEFGGDPVDSRQSKTAWLLLPSPL